MTIVLALFFTLFAATAQSFVYPPARHGRATICKAFDAPSDYDSQDLSRPEKSVSVSYDEEDEAIREDLKRELLLLSSVTNRGEYTSSDERDLVIDIVTQLGKPLNFAVGTRYTTY
jgi:hypothetical protein